MNRATNGFDKLSIPEFSLRLEYILNKMTGNADFPTLQADVDPLNDKADLYYPMVVEAEKGEESKIALRNASRADITNDLQSLSFGVSKVAKGNDLLLISSGFAYTQPPKPTPPMQKQPTPTITLGLNPGELLCTTIRQPGMKSVNYYITTDENVAKTTDKTGWTIYSYNRIKYLFTGLVSGQRYYIRVGLVGVRGQEALSEVVSFIPQ